MSRTRAAANRGWINASAYDVRGDLDLDGDVDLTDKSSASGSPATSGRTVLSQRGGILGLQGSTQYSAALSSQLCCRSRSLLPLLGRWSRRDDLLYSDGANMYAYCRSAPIRLVDPSGSTSEVDCGGSINAGQLSDMQIFVTTIDEPAGSEQQSADTACAQAAKDACAEKTKDFKCKKCPAPQDGCEPSTRVEPPDDGPVAEIIQRNMDIPTGTADIYVVRYPGRAGRGSPHAKKTGNNGHRFGNEVRCSKLGACTFSCSGCDQHCACSGDSTSMPGGGPGTAGGPGTGGHWEVVDSRTFVEIWGPEFTPRPGEKMGVRTIYVWVWD